ncbi:MAG: diguanylate cyclase [Sulfuritalea sp.]|nr:diguanylate cyclase [Sulfuritalea sp.]
MPAQLGVALFVDPEASQDEILKWADTAMYRAKEAGRNPIRLYHPGLNDWSVGAVGRRLCDKHHLAPGRLQPRI